MYIQNNNPFSRNQRLKMDPKNKEIVEKMPQKTKDSLQAEAFNYGGPFFSPKHQVNVDPEDGVLSNRPIYKDGSKLTYDILDKPTKRKTEANKPPSNPPKKKSEMVEGVDYVHFGKKSGINRDSKEPRKTTKGKGRNFRTVEEGAGMTEAGVADYKKKNPGSNLQTAVTKPVSELSEKEKARRRSFCARSKGWTGERGKAARERWNC